MSIQQPPVQKNQVIPVVVQDLNSEAYGVSHVNGYTLFIKDALPGEVVKAKVLKVKKNYGYAKAVEILKPSTARVEPPCSLFQKCGGCQLQHLTYAEQLKYKEQLVRNQLQRIGGLDLSCVKVKPILGMAHPWHYRNKSQIPIGEKEGRLIGGFYRPRSHEIINMDLCLIQHEILDYVLDAIKKLGKELGLTAYDEKQHRGLLRHVVVKYGFATNQLMIVLVTNGEWIPRQEELVRSLCRRFPNLKSIVQNINTKKTNVIFGDESRVLWGEPYIYDQIGSIQFAISARSFYQVNPIQTRRLYEQVMEMAQLSGEETVIDAYSGIGTISLFLAQEAKQVYGVEMIPEAVEDAWRNAQLNGITNVHFETGPAEEVLPRWRKGGIEAGVIVVDPPRKGCAPNLLTTILEMAPQRVVYVSCNPATLARDVKILSEGGYQLTQVQPVDMFPQTVHVECCAVLEKR